METVVDVHPDRVVIDGEHNVPVTAGQDPRAVALEWLTIQRANPTGQSVVVYAREIGGQSTHLVIHPGGAVTDVYTVSTPPPVPDMGASGDAGQPAGSWWDDSSGSGQSGNAAVSGGFGGPASSGVGPGGSQPPAGFGAAAPPSGPTPFDPPPAAAHSASPSAPAESDSAGPRAVSFIDDRPAGVDHVPAPPANWWQRMKGAFGLADQGPSAEEIAEQRDVHVVSQPWHGPRTIAVVNGKGGSNKTPTAVGLSAVFARHGGGGVLAWDNNETRGTLGWRTEKSPSHNATVQDLLPHTQELMDARAALSQIATYVHHQSADKYDVLRSNPELLAIDQRLTTEQFRAVHEVAQRYFRLTVVDSSNDESSYSYLNMLDAADQIVVASTTAPDRTENALNLIEALRNGSGYHQGLAERAVVIISQADREEEEPVESIAARFREFMPVDAVVSIPYDPALRKMQLRHEELGPQTRRAFLRAAAAIAERMSDQQPRWGRS